MMQAVVDTHKGRLRAAGTTVLDGGGMMPSEGQGGKSIGYIYRLVNSKVRQVDGMCPVSRPIDARALLGC